MPRSAVLQTNSKDEVVDELNRRSAARELARRHLVDFLVAMPPGANYRYGRHTLRFCSEFEHATEALDEGRSTYLILICPPRHGKSDIASRRYPPWHLGRRPDDEVILATYGASLSIELSRAARRCVASDEYEAIFGIGLSSEVRSAGDWRIAGRRGKLHAVGIEGAIVGHGADVLVIDDYCKNRAEAESELVRDHIWDAFRSDLMSRLAPTHIVAVIANRWHKDDLVGRIAAAMEEDAAFPRFRVVHFPAKDANDAWLFPERFSDRWYKAQRALAGTYAWEALFQGEPASRSGAMLRVEEIKYYESKPPFETPLIRFWDLASSERQRFKQSPDYSVGALGGVSMTGDLPRLRLDDVVRGQWRGPQRNRMIRACAERDGPSVVIGIETVAGYKDAAEELRELLHGRRVVETITPSKDKVIRAAPMEPVFEAGNVWLKQARWNAAYVSEIGAFPGGLKDDQVDATSGLFEMCRRRLGISAIVGL